MTYEVPPADTESLKKDANIKVLEGPETRVVYLGFDQERDELVESNIKGKNPYKDKRVREAMYPLDRRRGDQAHRDARPVLPDHADGGAGHQRLHQGSRQASAAAEAGRGQEAAGRRRLSERLRDRHGLPERPLRQRREDLPGRRLDAGQDRHQGESAGPDPQPRTSPRSCAALRTASRRTPASSCWAGRRPRPTTCTTCSSS